jgi:hypothetical protein
MLKYTIRYKELVFPELGWKDCDICLRIKFRLVQMQNKNYNYELLLKEAENERKKIQNMSEGNKLHTSERRSDIKYIFIEGFFCIL